MIDHDLNCASHGPDGAMCQKIRGHKGTDTERRNAAATIGVLVVRRYRRNITAWDVWLPLKHLVWLEVGVYGGSDIPVRMALGDFSELLRYAVGEWEAGDRP
jgi:hypothetical protein